MNKVNNWHIFRGLGREADDSPLDRLPPPPPWRDFRNPDRNKQQGMTFRTDPHVLEVINAAIYLRRPLLVQGQPGTGKSSLARAIATELGLPLYTWPINTRTTLQDGLYRYDALARLRDSQQPGASIESAEQVGRYITLGPLGSALLSPDRPAVLLIDEIDKGDIDLPNDLLHVFEEGEFFIPEIARALPEDTPRSDAHSSPVTITVYQSHGEAIRISGSQIRCQHFPIVVMTSNGERDFPPAFQRRCLRLDLNPPRQRDELVKIVQAHLGEEQYQTAEKVITQAIDNFLAARGDFDLQADRGKTLPQGHVATDQLLNLVYLMTQNRELTNVQSLSRELLRPLGEGV